MIVGRENLIELFPDFKDDVAENGIDLRVGKIEKPVSDGLKIGCINDTKLLPVYEIVKPIDNRFYMLEPHKFYFVSCDREIKIPNGYCQIYLIRSTLARCGLQLISSVGDNGFEGTLKMGIVNNNDKPIYIGINERIIQALTIKNDGTADNYNGVYQNDSVYVGKDINNDNENKCNVILLK